MKIAIIIDLIDDLSNGSVITARRFADGLRARGHQVKVVAIGADGTDDCSLKARYVPVLSEVASKNFMRFAKFDHDKIKGALAGVDVAHFIFPFKFEKLCKRLADQMNVATTCAFHCQPENVSFNVGLGNFKPFNDFIYAFFRHGFYKNFNRIHCPSTFIANKLKEHGYAGELYVFSNGYDPAFKPLSSPKDMGEKFEIAMTGRLSPEKNQRVILQAIAKSKHRHKIRLSLFGKGACKSALERLAKTLGVDVEFSFLDKDALIYRLQRSHLYVHSATVEIEAIATIEAIACGLVPVIANSPLSATPQFALDDRSLFESGNPDDLAQKIDFWIEHESERIRAEKEYADHALNFCLERSLTQAEKMFSDEICSHRTKTLLTIK